MIEKFLPISTWNLLGATEQHDQMQLRLLKVFAEICSSCGQLEKPGEKVEAVFTVLQVSCYNLHWVFFPNCANVMCSFSFRNICLYHHSIRSWSTRIHRSSLHRLNVYCLRCTLWANKCPNFLHLPTNRWSWRNSVHVCNIWLEALKGEHFSFNAT